MSTRPYIITSKDGTQRLIQAASQSQALRHVANQQFTAKAASANDVIDLMAKGVKPEAATADDNKDSE